MGLNYAELAAYLLEKLLNNSVKPEHKVSFKRLTLVACYGARRSQLRAEVKKLETAGNIGYLNLPEELLQDKCEAEEPSRGIVIVDELYVFKQLRPSGTSISKVDEGLKAVSKALNKQTPFYLRPPWMKRKKGNS